MSRIDTQMRPSEAARWWRDHPEPAVPTEESAYLKDAKRCSVDHGQGKPGERKRTRINDGRDVAAGEWYRRGTLRLA
jgi:hypothetical protein